MIKINFKIFLTHLWNSHEGYLVCLPNVADRGEIGDTGEWERSQTSEPKNPSVRSSVLPTQGRSLDSFLTTLKLIFRLYKTKAVIVHSS